MPSSRILSRPSKTRRERQFWCRHPVENLGHSQRSSSSTEAGGPFDFREFLEDGLGPDRLFPEPPEVLPGFLRRTIAVEVQCESLSHGAQFKAH